MVGVFLCPRRSGSWMSGRCCLALAKHYTPVIIFLQENRLKKKNKKKDKINLCIKKIVVYLYRTLKQRKNDKFIK
jgi:hypothetical protein